MLDHVKALELLLLKVRPGEIYNIDSDTALSNVNLVKLVLHEMGKPQSLIRRVKDRPVHDHRYALSFEKIRRELGWKPEHDFTSDLRKTIRRHSRDSKHRRRTVA